MTLNIIWIKLRGMNASNPRATSVAFSSLLLLALIAFSPKASAGPRIIETRDREALEAERIAEESSKQLFRAAVSNPEVLRAIQAASVEAANLSPFDARLERKFSIDSRISFPLGAGAGIQYSVETPLFPVALGGSVDTTGLTYSVSADATVEVLIEKIESRFVPVVNVGFHHIRFTGYSNDAIVKFNPYLQRNGIEVDMRGISMNGLSVQAGVDFVGFSGFHFTFLGGKMWQLGESQGGEPEKGVTLRGWQSYTLQFNIGYRF